MKKEKQAFACARCDLGGLSGGQPSRNIYVYVPGTAGTLPVSSHGP